MSTTQDTTSGSSYTLKNLNAVEDVAPKFGIPGGQARFPREDLDLVDTGCALFRLDADKRHPIAHRHDLAEEVYLVLGGSGRVKLDDEIVELSTFDAVRVAPNVTRQFEAGPDGMEYLAFGARHEGDGEIVQDWWTD